MVEHEGARICHLCVEDQSAEPQYKVSSFLDLSREPKHSSLGSKDYKYRRAEYPCQTNALVDDQLIGAAA